MLGFKLRQHIVEFFPGIGMVTDGAVDATSVNGPWNWTVPEGILGRPVIDACNGGGGGDGGALLSAGDISCGGGGGGGATALLNYPVFVAYPGETWTIAVGAAGLGGAVGAAAAHPGATTITAPNAVQGDVTRNLPLTTAYYSAAQASASSTSYGSGGSSGHWMGTNVSTGGSASGATGNTGGSTFATLAGTVWIASGGGGGAGNATGSTTGGAGGVGGYDLTPGFVDGAIGWGSTDGTVSYGGGGGGGSSPFGSGGAGGKTTVSGPSPTVGYGHGGGGGGGNQAGGDGGPGMLRIIYWSMD